MITYLTDPSVHPLWVHPDVDLHLALHEVAASQARALGGTTTVIAPLLPRSGNTAESVWELRTRLGLPVEDDLALVVGGSCGIGELESAADDILAAVSPARWCCAVATTDSVDVSRDAPT